MTHLRTLVLDCLLDLGLGPQRLTSAKSEAELFGQSGILNSLELVQFIAGLSETTGIDAFAFMESFQNQTENIFRSVDSLVAFLANETPPQAEA
ncbi:MAG: hypothetical protein ACRC14_06490 [Paracoccaceae bacterium]